MCLECKNAVTEFSPGAGRCRPCRTRYDRDRKVAKYTFLAACVAGKRCEACGEGEPMFLDLDHRDRAEKVLGVKDMASRCLPDAVIRKEVAKCRILCVRCHRAKTAFELGAFAWAGFETRNPLLAAILMRLA